ncbi:hypothetical protein K504DRAFT_487646 [Pleomassaria siparia CBS 279.74]|uniref:Lysine-specific metallo-endopeptidase domain-containing protein n=1 Tax=Pleomassaria siparia CBS 279.74 TaxID=1314801 RepID=A0A6G1KK05_9PLEO|nr:hypothetical protein K504DRAFT_487646 [Pleomassaria siparia CBS 279.74]
MGFTSLPSFGFLFLNLFLSLNSVIATSYWVDPSCSNYGDLADAIPEAIWNAGKLSDAIGNQDPLWQQPLTWMFGFDYASTDSFGTYNRLLVQNTFYRIGQVTQAASRLDANIRFYCDDDARYVAVNAQGVAIPEPDNDDAAYATTYFYDQDNDSVALGRELGCKKAANTVDVVYAHTIVRINERYDAYRKNIFSTSTQLTDRVTISICQTMYGSQNAHKLYTWKSLAKKDLRQISSLPYIVPNAAQVITHELAHVPALSSQVMIEPSGSDGAATQMYHPHGIDFHPRGSTSSSGARGYWYATDTQTPGEFLTDRSYTIMNPDSYAYLASMFRLYGKRWVSQRLTGAFVTLRPDRSLSDVGDWDTSTTAPRSKVSSLTYYNTVSTTRSIYVSRTEAAGGVTTYSRI